MEFTSKSIEVRVVSNHETHTEAWPKNELRVGDLGRSVDDRRTIRSVFFLPSAIIRVNGREYVDARDVVAYQPNSAQTKAAVESATRAAVSQPFASPTPCDLAAQGFKEVRVRENIEIGEPYRGVDDALGIVRATPMSKFDFQRLVPNGLGDGRIIEVLFRDGSHREVAGRHFVPIEGIVGFETAH